MDEQEFFRYHVLTRAVACAGVDRDLRTLKERLAEITDLYSSLCLLDWDQKVKMPPGGYPARAEALATLGRIESRTKSTGATLTTAPDGTPAHSQCGNVP